MVAADAEIGIRYALTTNPAGLPKTRWIAPACVYNAVSSEYASTKALRNAAPGSRPEAGLVGEDSIKFNSKVRKSCISDSSHV